MRDADGLTPGGIAHLRGRGWAAVRTALAVLHARGAVAAGRPGTVRRTGALPPEAEPLERALLAALYDGEAAPRDLADRPDVRQAVGDLRRDLVRRGLVRPQRRRVLVPLALVVVPPWLLARLIDLVSVHVGLLTSVALVAAACWFVPRRTLAGARTLRHLSARHPDPTDAAVGPAVALYGADALRATMPHFARDAGLLGPLENPGTPEPPDPHATR